jgi:hypothetical protein
MVPKRSIPRVLEPANESYPEPGEPIHIFTLFGRMLHNVNISDI